MELARFIATVTLERRMTLLDELARRVARLTAAEAGALADAYSPPRDTNEIREWYGELHYAMAYASRDWNDLCDGAYEVARPFKDTETWHPLIDVGLCIADPPDPLIAEALLAPWRRVILDTPIDPYRVEYRAGLELLAYGQFDITP